MSSSEGQISWLGLMVEDMIVDRNIGTGAFSHLFRGCGLELPVNAVFKLSKENSELKPQGDIAGPSTRTQSLGFFTGGYYSVIPDASFLLCKQFEKLYACKDSGLVNVQHLANLGGMSYMRMDYLEGESFRSTIANGGARLAHFIEIAGTLKRLGENADFAYHGDLKPENIMHTGRGLKLIDCGYFGLMQCEDGELDEVAVTTPCYYPALKPDDLFAFGVMLFEAATGFHPLLGGLISGSSALRFYPLSVELREQLDLLNDLGFPDLEPLATLPLVNQLAPHMRPEIVRLLLSCLRLQIGPDGLLREKIIFGDFAELEAHMLKLLDLGLDIG